jgi:hypothetical protein
MRLVISDLGIERAPQRQRFLQPTVCMMTIIIIIYYYYYYCIMYTPITELNRGIRLLGLVNASAWLYEYGV